MNENGRPWSGVSGKMLPYLQQRNWDGVEGFTLISYIDQNEFNLIGENNEMLPYKLAVMEVDSLYDKVFTPSVISGSWEQASRNRNSIVLTQHTALQMFGDINKALGKQIVGGSRFTNTPMTYTIQAVIEDLPENTSMNFMRTVDMLKVNDDGGYVILPTTDITGYTMYALLNSNYTSKQLNETLRQAKYKFLKFDKEYPICARSLGEDHPKALLANMMAIVTAIVGLLVLLAASLNFFHFQTGSFLNRGREFSIRKILGNSTIGLFWMLFAQITIVILLATLISGCFIELASPFLHISLFRFSIQMTKDELIPHLFQYMGGMLLLTAMVALGVAFYIRRAITAVSLYGLGNANGKKRLRNFMLGVQFFICWFFVSMATGLYLQSEKTSSTMFDTLTRQEKEEILCVPLDYNFLNSEDRQIIISHIRQHAGVSDIMFTDVNMMTNRMLEMKESPDTQEAPEVCTMGTTSNYADFLHIDLKGQNPQKEDEILVSRSFASKLGENVIGKSLYDNRNSAFVITGIVNDINSHVYTEGATSANYGKVYFKLNESKTGKYGYVKCYPTQTNDVQTWIEQKLREVFPSSIEPKIRTLQSDIEEFQALENELKGIILFFSLVCLIITLLGVYSTITLDTERRQKEVAIRKVNGAGLKEIILLFARLYIRLLGISFLLATPIIYLVLLLWKQMYLVFFDYGILYWGSILLGVTAITTLTVIFHILKIARINPATIIKSE